MSRATTMTARAASWVLLAIASYSFWVADSRKVGGACLLVASVLIAVCNSWGYDAEPSDATSSQRDEATERSERT